MTNEEHERMERKHIFIVNGEPTFLEFMRELFQLERYNVTTTNFLPRTFEQIQATCPDLIIVDIVFREQAGWDLLQRLHQASETENIPVIVVSTDPHLLETAKQEAERYAGDRFFLKPMDIPDLLETVHSLVGPAG